MLRKEKEQRGAVCRPGIGATGLDQAGVIGRFTWPVAAP